MIPCAISGSGSGPGSLINIVIIVIRIVRVAGLVWIVRIITDHHVFDRAPSSGRVDLLLLDLGVVDFALVVRVRAPPGTLTTRRMPPSQEPLERRRLDHRLTPGILKFRLLIPDDGDGSRLHLPLLRGASSALRRLVLRALAQNAEDIPVVGPLQRLPESPPLLAPSRSPLSLGSLQEEQQGADAPIAQSAKGARPHDFS